MADTIEEGDIIRVHLTGRVNNHEGPVFQTTEEAVAQEEGLNEDGQHAHYDPKLVIVGKKQVLDGVDEALVGMKVDDEKQVEIESEKAFGPVDNKKRQFMSYREFKKKFKKAPRVGDFIELPKTREQGRVIRNQQGKVLIDTNHMLAGRTVYYTIKVIEKLEGEDAKLMALIEQRLTGIPSEEIKINREEKGILEITIPSNALFYQQFGLMAYMLSTELQREFEEYEKIRLITEFEKPKAPEPSEEDGDTGEEDSGNDDEEEANEE